ncbi:DUF2167 domain-containing protein [Candidatus Pelagibacter sp.]|uniref:DUF2167 domain-containing protein n=1 Tax=Candidatus Pelagibacter sp. TaxID=2024849 RepID=UPI003F858881
MKKLFSIILLIILTSFKSYAIDENIPQTEEEWFKAYNSLPWEDGPLEFNYNEANSKINVPNDFSILKGEDAHQMLFWLNGISFDYVDMYALRSSDNSQYMFFYTDSGYVKTDDWTDVDPDQYIKEIRENYRVGNETRKKNGQPTIVNVEWKKKPYLDGIYNSVYYALDVTWSDNRSTVEGRAIILGREGYTTASYVGGERGYDENMLLNLSKIHKFNPTKEYKDWKAGDKVAAAGIGALLATTLGVKYLKPGLLAVAAVFLKKFWFIIFLPFIWLFKLFSGSSKKKKS